MNRNLLVFGLFLIIAGVFTSFYLLSVFGFLMVIPALLGSSRPPPLRGPGQQNEASRRVMPQTAQPPPTDGQKSPPAQVKPMAAMAPLPSPQSQQLSYSPALFPTTLLPSLSLSMAAPQPPEQVSKSQAKDDELVEMGAILALARLLLG
ncbi:MAG: hypothetical protein JRM77_06165 [Nitrososphaerota archaeon]|nr:hypothetical protein [Nitrososphaerota archaeon]